MLRKLLFPILFLACGDSTGPEAIAGNYTLRTIDGQDLPAVILQVLNDKVEVTAGSLRINSDLTFSSSLTAAATTSGTTTSATDTQTGTYTLNGTAITLRFQDASTSTGSITGNTLTVIDEGLSLVYRK